MSSYSSLHYHLVFSTKYRKPLIADAWRQRLHTYLGGTVNGLGGHSQGVGGVEDHVHLLVGLRPTACLSDFTRELKKATTSWVREQGGVSTFRWQEGYAAFTVSATSRTSVKAYIANQVEHHRTQTFREELIAMLKRAGIDFDETRLADDNAVIPTG